MFEQDTYKEDIKLFKKVLSEEAEQLLTHEALAIVYIGRETCPFCRKFAKKLSKLAHEINSPIYYVESDNSLDNQLSSFREKYQIVTVPGFMVGKNGVVEVRCDSSTPEEELLNMIN